LDIIFRINFALKPYRIGFSSQSVCLSVCLFVRSITQKQRPDSPRDFGAI